MGLNKSKGNMFKFVTHTWNVVKGKCPHDCSYCYMKRFSQKDLYFDRKELNTNLGERNEIFVGSSCDMFANEIPNEWILEILGYCRKYPQNGYLFQSKNPQRFFEYDYMFPGDTILATTLETNKWNLLKKYSGGDLSARSRIIAIENYMIRYMTFVTIEPIMDFNLDYFVSLLRLSQAYQINIGADSGHNNLPEPSREKILELISELKKFTKVHLKKNLDRLLKED